jgi:hypothetical protein
VIAGRRGFEFTGRWAGRQLAVPDQAAHGLHRPIGDPLRQSLTGGDIWSVLQVMHGALAQLIGRLSMAMLVVHLLLNGMTRPRVLVNWW